MMTGEAVSTEAITYDRERVPLVESERIGRGRGALLVAVHPASVAALSLIIPACKRLHPCSAEVKHERPGYRWRADFRPANRVRPDSGADPGARADAG